MTAEEEIRRRIGQRGPITFAEFMDLALFWPQGGYYLSDQNIGASGDFYTSPHAHPAFGALLAVQLHQMWQVLSEPDPFTVVEMGAGGGLLGWDLAAYAARLPGAFGRSLRYICLDPHWAAGVERETSSEAGASTVARIAAAIPRAPLRGIRGCFLSNEFLDSLPVHQVTLSRGSLKEVYITLRGDRLATTLGEPSTSALAARLDGLGIELAEGQTAEISLGIEIWAAEMAEALDAGFVLTVDYGHLARELYSFEQRRRGTLTTYYRHTQTDTPLRRIGRQDITAQVDFTTVINSGRRAGLEVLGIATQGRFLSNLGLAELRRRLIPLELPRRQFLANNVGMLDLARPGGLGGFRVLAQGKKVGHPALWGFEASERAIAIARESPVPLLREDHLPLLEARYPHVGMELEGSWPFAHEVPEHGRL